MGATRGDATFGDLKIPLQDNFIFLFSMPQPYNSSPLSTNMQAEKSPHVSFTRRSNHQRDGLKIENRYIRHFRQAMPTC